MKKLAVISSLAIITFFSLSNKIPPAQMYFPPKGGNTWQSVTPKSLDWDDGKIPALTNFLIENHTKAFIILVNGRIVMEEYMNNHKQWKPWYWASAGKTLTAATFGIAQQEGFVKIDAKVSDYLSKGWTSEPAEKERLINCRHLLTMTSGLDDGLGNDVSVANLKYKADAGTRWAYHNIYVKLQDVIAKATGKSWEAYFNKALKEKIGMTGKWINIGPDDELSVYASNARSMARFGLLALNKGNWDGQQIINETYFNEMISVSQNINKSYGYLWWLNGEESYHLPASEQEFKGPLIPNGPKDMYMALGKNDQKIYVIPSKNMVVIRMGESANGKNFALSGFDDALWKKLNDVIK